MACDRSLEIGVLGPLQRVVDGAPVPLGPPKQRAVLARLVVSRNRPVTVDTLTAAVWDDRPPTEARTSIHSYVSNLRKRIGAGGADARAVLAAASPGYRLSISDDACDLGRFLAAKSAGLHAMAVGRFAEAAGQLTAGLAEWRGPVLDDLRDCAFRETFAAALTEEKVLAHTVKAEADIACGRAFAAINELEPLTAEYPYREPLWAQLITAYYLCDRQADALNAYTRLRDTLAEELGIDPSPTLRTLHDRVLRQESLDVKKAAAKTAAITVTALDLRSRTAGGVAVAHLRQPSGHTDPLRGVATRIGRRSDNDIVVDDAAVSRQHAVIIDTDANYVIYDLKSANGVYVQQQKIRSATTLKDGDEIRIGDHEFTFHIGPRAGDDDADSATPLRSAQE